MTATKIQLTELGTYSCALRNANDRLVIFQFRGGQIYDDISRDGLVHEDVCTELLDPRGSHAGKFQIAHAPEAPELEEISPEQVAALLRRIEQLEAAIQAKDAATVAPPETPAPVIDDPDAEQDWDGTGSPPQLPEKAAAAPSAPAADAGGGEQNFGSIRRTTATDKGAARADKRKARAKNK